MFSHGFGADRGIGGVRCGFLLELCIVMAERFGQVDRVGRGGVERDREGMDGRQGRGKFKACLY